jgi:hypothetical protein
MNRLAKSLRKLPLSFTEKKAFLLGMRARLKLRLLKLRLLKLRLLKLRLLKLRLLKLRLLKLRLLVG